MLEDGFPDFFPIPCFSLTVLAFYLLPLSIKDICKDLVQKFLFRSIPAPLDARPENTYEQRLETFRDADPVPSPFDEEPQGPECDCEGDSSGAECEECAKLRSWNAAPSPFDEEPQGLEGDFELDSAEVECETHAKLRSWAASQCQEHEISAILQTALCEDLSQLIASHARPYKEVILWFKMSTLTQYHGVFREEVMSINLTEMANQAFLVGQSTEDGFVNIIRNCLFEEFRTEKVTELFLVGEEADLEVDTKDEYFNASGLTAQTRYMEENTLLYRIHPYIFGEQDLTNDASAYEYLEFCTEKDLLACFNKYFGEHC